MKNSSANILMGSWNSNVVAEKVDSVIGPYGLSIRNDRVTRFVELCQQNNLVITNTWFKLPKRLVYGWRSPQDRAEHITRNHIDHITINNSFRNSILSPKAYPGCDVNSDNDPVAATRSKSKDKIAWITAKGEQLERKVQEDSYTDFTRETNIENTWTGLKKNYRSQNKPTKIQKKKDG